MHSLTSLACRSAAVAALVLSTAAACNSSDAVKQTDAGVQYDKPFCSLPVSCQEIVAVCHEKDVGVGEVHECHETAHDQATDSACKAAHDKCIATCTAAPAIEGGVHETFGPCEGGAPKGDH